ncbi:MAG TPA: cation diffusion facilitator family transporter [Polyangiaceae bacterium]|nr:cation diffusion facilitator family transporter [Polyangiaceae bacterium]
MRVALLFTTGFMIVEAIVGFQAQSLALLADAGHMLGDAGALVLALLAAVIAVRPRTAIATFGYRRAEVLAAFVNGVALALLAILILREAVERWLMPAAINTRAVMGCAALGLAVNLWVARMLHQGASNNVNMRAALLHVLSDAVGSVGVLLSAALVALFDWQRADAVTSALIAVLIASSGWRILKHTAGVLLESVPAGVDVRRVEQCIASTPGVLGFHDLHVWRISDGFDVVSVHVTLQPDAHGVEVSRAVSSRIAAELGIDHVTVQPEAAPPNELVSLRQSRDGRVLTR